MVTHTPEGCLVVLAGEIEFEVRHVFDKVMGSLDECPDDAPVIIVDLSGVTFLDSSGLGGLVGIQARARDRGQSVTLKRPSPSVLRLFQITGLDTLFSIES